MMPVTTILAAVSAAVAAGTAFAFSSFVMRGLGMLSEADAVRAMQAINVAAVHPAFLSVFMGTGLLALGLSAAALLGAGGISPPWLHAATAVYVVGLVFVTIGGNVPLNDSLATFDADTLSAGAWSTWSRAWLRYNHVRTVAGSVASGLFMMAVLRA